MNSTLPTHVAFIVDGNRRWARQRGLSEVIGHTRVVDKTLDDLVGHAVKLGISYITFWVFSTDNWKRGKKFAGFLFSLVERYLNAKAEYYHSQGYRVKIIGDTGKLPTHTASLLLNYQEKTKANKGITITIAINYGGRDEIIRAINKISKKKLNNLTIEQFSQFLDTAGMPDPDMIIRTGGEKRLSGFLLWQAEYAELYFTEVLMPDFTPEEFDKALAWFAGRERRFGK